MLKSKFVVFLLFVLCVKAHAQETFLETTYTINDLYYNQKTSEIIYVNDKTLYIADYETLSIKDSVKLIGDQFKDKYLSSFKYF